MEKLQRERSIARSIFTRTKNKLLETLNHKDYPEIHSSYEIFSEKAQTLFGVDERIQEQWLQEAECNEEEIVRDSEIADTYKQEYFKLKFKFEKIHNEDSGSKFESASVSDNAKHLRRLPKLELVKFDGKAKNWLGFWSSFKKIHADQSIDDDDKMAYLTQSMTLESPAYELVKSFPPCGENYAQAIDQLKSRYARDELLIEIYVRELLSLVLQRKEKTSMSISSLYDKLKTQLRALEVLGVTSDKYAAMLYPLVESALPEEMLRVWERQRGKDAGTDTLKGLLEFVRVEVESEERIQIARTSLNVDDENEQTRMPTAACLVAGDAKVTSKSLSNNTTTCVWCDKTSHSSLECYKAQRMTLEARNEMISKKKACTVCLKPGHVGKKCKSYSKCIICQKKHAVLLCPEIKTTGSTNSDNSELMLASKTNGTTLLQTLTVKIGNETVRAFIDTGAQRSYIRRDVTSRLKLVPDGEEKLKHCLFGGVETKEESHQVFNLTVKSMTEKVTLNMTALSKEKICGYVPRIRHEASISQKLKQYKLSLTDIGDNTPEIGLLIGADYAGRIMTGDVIPLNEDLFAIQTKLGWTLQGIVAPKNDTIIATVDLHSQDITCLWNLEVLGIEEPKDKILKKRTEEEAIEAFKENVCVNREGRYEVVLPWKIDRPDLLENRLLAEKRLQSTTKRLESLNELHNYGAVFKEWLGLGVIEEDPDITVPGHYLSHHAVIKESSLTTRVRPVYDASARDFNGNSINACLEKGINFLELIPILLTRFRMHAVGITSDIKKAFLQISLAEEDRKYLRFLWWSEKGDIVVYRHCRVVFGLTCSPFLLAATLIHHLEKYTTSEYAYTVQTLKDSFYVDNCVTSVRSREEADKFIRESGHLMNEGKFDLRGWITAPIQCENTDKQVNLSVLGLTWHTEADDLCCNVNPLKTCNEDVTRRELLSICNRVFDPIGFSSPMTLIPKLLLQRTWGLNVGWDTKLPDDIQTEFKKWLDDVHWLRQCRIPRRLTSEPIEKGKNTLHTFSDASKHAYATCTFLRSETDKGVSVQLVLAKSRVTPVKEISIPRLELIAALMSTRIYVQACSALRLLDCKAYFWTDSSVAMTWITTGKEWSIFVKNRVREIREVSKPEDWRHIKGTLNPADLPSRGCSGKKLAESKWWEGPAWLKESEDKWPVSMEMNVNKEDINKELKKSKITVNNTDSISENFTTSLMRMSKYSKIVRSVAWIWRFLNNCKASTKTIGDLTLDEIEHAEKSLLRVVQKESLYNGEEMKGAKDLDTFVDSNGILRVKTRLTLKEESESFKAPILVNGKHPIIERLVEQRHRQYLHAGVHILFPTLRNEYWIVGGKRVARKIIARCAVCKRFKVASYKTPTAPLPDNRVENTGVFQVTGVDAAGPLMLNTGEKSWMILFTCAVYRAIHIELVIYMSTECFIMALRRFIARRGRVQIIYSDNGTNFVGAENLFSNVDWDLVKDYSTAHRIKWIFNPPAAPWWGGWWERMIRMVKELLRRNLGKASLTLVELETLLCDIESVINSRPLTYVAENDALRPLTPESFLHSLQGTEVPDLAAIDANSLNARQKYVQRLRTDLRQRFRNEYLSLLVSRRQMANRTVQKGDVVIVETDAKRWNWPLGIVLEVYAGRDGQCRVAKVKTTDGLRTRPVQRLYPLEISPEEATVEVPIEGALEVPRTSKSGRLLKIPRRLDL